MSFNGWMDALEAREFFKKAYPNSTAFDDGHWSETSEFDRDTKNYAVLWWKLTTSEEHLRDLSSCDEIDRIKAKLWLLKYFPYFIQNVYLWKQSRGGYVSSDEWRELEKALNR